MNLTKQINFINVILAENYLFRIITEYWQDLLKKIIFSQPFTIFYSVNDNIFILID